MSQEASLASEPAIEITPSNRRDSRDSAGKHALRAEPSPDRVRELEIENHKLRHTVGRLRKLAFLDGLTGLPNRRHFNLALESEVRRARRARGPLALILCDLDYFKRVNDTFGHQAGDEVLRGLGRVLENVCCRAGDLAARFGGEEFAVLLPGVDAADAPGIARGLCRDIAARPMLFGKPARATRITASFGVSSVRPAARIEPARLVLAADTALLEAKRSGRNCVRFRGMHDIDGAPC